MKAPKTLLMLIGALSLMIVPAAFAGDIVDEGANDAASEAEVAVGDPVSAPDEPADETGKVTEPVDETGGTNKCTDPGGCEEDPCAKQECKDPEPEPEPEPEPTPEPELPEFEIPDPPVLGETEEAGGQALPFTGIEDYFVPVALGLMGLAMGFLLYRYAFMSDTMAKYRRQIRDDIEARRTKSAYGDAAKRIDKDDDLAA